MSFSFIGNTYNYEDNDQVMKDKDQGMGGEFFQSPPAKERRFECLNEYNKRLREDDNIEDDVEDEEIYTILKDTPKFNFNRIKPFCETLSQLPGCMQNQKKFLPGYKENRVECMLKNSDDQRRHKIWKCEMDKEEIRQIMRLNKVNRIHSRDVQRDIGELGNVYNKAIFTSGTRSKF